MMSPSFNIIVADGTPWTTTEFTDVHILPGKGLPKGFGKPLNVGTAPWSLMNDSAIMSRVRVLTPGLMCLPTSSNVFDTKRLALRISSISSSVLRKTLINPLQAVSKQIQHHHVYGQS